MVADGYRNQTWNDAIARAFNDKRRRVRRKGLYLRIQASTLAPSHPRVALELLDIYFALPEGFDHAQAHVDRTMAYLALNPVQDVLMAYESALARESIHPNLKTEAYIALPYLIATRRIRDLYGRAKLLASGRPAVQP